MTVKDRQRIEHLEKRIGAMESNLAVLMHEIKYYLDEIKRNDDKFNALLDSDEFKCALNTFKSYVEEAQNAEEKEKVRH